MNYTILMFTLFLISLLFNLFITTFISELFVIDIENHQLLKYLFQILIYMGYFYYFKLISRRMISSNQTFIIIKSNIFSLMTILSFSFLLKDFDNYSRGIILLYFITNFSIPILIYFLKKHFLQYKIFRENIIVICDNNGEVEVMNWFQENNSFGFDIKKIINVEKKNFIESKNLIKTELEKNNYYAAVIDISDRKTKKLFLYVDLIQQNISRVIVLPKLSKIPLFNGEIISSINHKGMAVFVKNNLLNPVDQRIKRIFDYITCCIGIICLLPILILLYILVYLDTKGKPIYKQRRIGQDSKSFNIYKFRTMVINSDEVLQKLLESDEKIKEEWEKDFKLKDDPRITKLGNFLRKTSLDELPQLINVLQGKMSLVGPRPIIDQEIQKYGEYFEYFKAVKPGITGLWQVSGRNDIEYDERVQLDVWYVRNWSVEIDLTILLKTIIVVFSRKGSY